MKNGKSLGGAKAGGHIRSTKSVRTHGVAKRTGSATARTPRKPRAVESHAQTRQSVSSPRSARTTRSVASQTVPDTKAVTQAKGESGAFVDARALRSEDYVTETLQQTAGTLGIASRPKVVDFSERSRERKRASLRVIAIRTAAVLASLVVLGALIWLLFFSTVFRLETTAISVSGANEWVSEQTIRQIADGQAGKSLFLVSTDEVSDQLKSIPGVSEAKVSKQLPKSMSVEVKAQKPAAMLKAGDTLTAVDSKARVLNSVSDTNANGIPVIEVRNIETSLKNQSVKEALTILGALPESMRQSITKVTAETQDSITTTLNDGQRVIVWGDSSELKLKMAVVDKIINDPNVIGDKTQVDVSAPLKPIIK